MYEVIISELPNQIDQLFQIVDGWIESSTTHFWIGTCVTIIGWFLVFFLSRLSTIKAQRNEIERRVRIDVYGKLYELKQIVDECASNLAGILQPVIIETAAVIAFADNVMDRDVQHWRDYTESLRKDKENYRVALRKYLSHTEAWVHLFPAVDYATSILFFDLIPSTEKEIDIFWVRLLDMTNNQPNDNQVKKLKEDTERLRHSVIKIMFAFVDDHFDLVSNELFSKIDQKTWKVRCRDEKIEEGVNIDILTLHGVRTMKGKRKY